MQHTIVWVVIYFVGDADQCSWFQ